MTFNHGKIARRSVAALACTTLIATLGAGSAYAASPNVATHSQQDIRAYVEASGADFGQEATYAVEPDMKAPYENPGELSDATKKNALAALNDVRYVAGLDANVTLSDQLGREAQAGAYVNAVNNEMSHTPKKPANMPDSLYRLGYTGTSSSNLAWGYGTLGYATIGWTADEDPGNIDRIGHRRWLLNPTLGKTGYGAVNDQFAISVFDDSARGGQSNVAWPAQQMPVDWFGGDYPWSLSTGSYVSPGSTRVTLKRESDGKVWSFEPGKDNNTSGSKYFNVDNQYYGEPGCIIFRPDGVSSYKPGDVYDVSITGASSSSIDYKVEFFALRPVQSVRLNKSKLKLKVGDSYNDLTTTVAPENATEGDVTWTTSNKSVATVDEDGWIEGVSAGKATITAEAGGKSARVTVTVVDPEAERASKVNAIEKTTIPVITASRAGKKKVALAWQTEGTGKLKGYQVYQSTLRNAGFKKVATTKTTTATVRKALKSKKTYYFKVRGYGKVAGKTVYTGWSATKRVKVK